jgi:ABC-type transport system involved in cytochrome c biogenesis permease subunit
MGERVKGEKKNNFFSISLFAVVFITVGFLCASFSLLSKALCPGERGNVPLLAGEAAELEGDMLLLNEFKILKYPSGKIRQYESDVSVITRNSDTALRKTISVNHPLKWKGFWIYQSAYNPQDGSTILLAVRDKTLFLASLGGVFLLLGSFILCFLSLKPFGKEPQSRIAKILRILMGFAAVIPPLFIIIRACLRPEPMPALQSPLMAPHVAAYIAGYVILLFSVFGIGRRWMPIGFFFITFGLVTGAVWGKICWGDFWQYDPKEMWSLATWLCYAGYFIFRRWTYPERILRYLGGLLIILTLTWVNFSNLFKGLHSYA